MTFRDATLSDASALAALTAELGYSAPVDAISARLQRLASSPHDLVVVAEAAEGVIAGWLQAHAATVLESGFRVEIVGLVVGGAFRRQGIGSRLVDYAEAWANQLGAKTMVVRSNSQRTESHQFYPARGYVSAKTQLVYRKPLSGLAR